MWLQVICYDKETDSWEAIETRVKRATEEQNVKTLFAKSVANQHVQQLASEYGDLTTPHLWTSITRVRPGAGLAIVGNPE